MKKFTPILLLIILVVAGYTAVYFYKRASALKANPNAVAQKEATDLVAVVGKLIVLPEGELPVVVTVVDPEKLKGQVFFAKAKVGDKVLFYSSVQKAYLYDPENNKILEVAAINPGTQTTQRVVEQDTNEEEEN